ncbi:MAG: 50S ribosomal protein L32 [Candidatus Magasanikbacteria bacterium]|nr:50S ribosomal protein L32 [Candidatus Magasanikbacteria bacterium]
MALPGHRRTSGDKGRNATARALKELTLNSCPKCGKATLPHRACRFCGTYRGRQVITVAKKLAKTKQA